MGAITVAPEGITVADCQVCTRPTDVSLCPGCLQKLEGELREVPWLVEQLEVTLTRQARVGDRNGPRSSERPLPYDHGASVDLETLTATLRAWAESIAERRGVPLDTTATPTALAAWLRLWPSELASHPDAADMHDEVCSATHAARRTIDRRPELRFVGLCDAHGAAEVNADHPNGCAQEMHALPQAHTASCRGCGATYPMDSRRAWLLEAAYDRLLTAAEMSRAIRELIPGKEITPNRISQWAARGKITKYLPHPKDAHQRPRFRVEDVITTAREAESYGRASGAA